MPSSVFGLPLHPLIVHATVVLVPLTALAVAGAVLVPRFRRWAGPVPTLLGLVALVLTPLSTASGENLEHSMPESRLIEKHAELGDQLIPFTIGLFVLAAAFWWLERRRRVLRGPGAVSRDRLRPVVVVVGVAALLVAIGTCAQVVRIGHSGAEAAWSGSRSAAR